MKEAKRIKEEEAKKAGKEIEIEEEIEEAATDITLRSLNLDDIREAKQQV